VKRGFVVALAIAAIVVAGMTGCSSKKSCSGGACGSTAQGSAKVTVDGKDQSVSGTITCVTSGNMVAIGVGNPGTTGAVAAQVTTDNPPKVNSVALGNVGGLNLAVGPGAGDATATKDGSTYKITGHATGADMSNPMAGPQTKPFEMDVTCP
jgi:ipoprotein LpqH